MCQNYNFLLNKFPKVFYNKIILLSDIYETKARKEQELAFYKEQLEKLQQICNELNNRVVNNLMACGRKLQAIEWIIDNIDFDQAIYEGGNDVAADWFHISFRKGRNRKQALRMVKKAGKTSYIPYSRM